MYLAACEILRGKGFRQYEISNFARKGLYSRHNMKYWTAGEYLGFGPNASSDFGGKRFTMVRDLQGYINGIRNNGEVIAEIDEVPLRERAGEYLMLRLRTSAGILGTEYERKYLLPFAPIEEALENCRAFGHAAKGEDGRWRLTPKGYLISNSIISDLLLIQDKSVQLQRFGK
jgi:oxygen-independent coproporphyrinogen-3 oxidase